ncbi:MAG TPA: MFS transporter [Spirochaetota bacterium]|nr:MFS transporter [Spirochaetota bacterium]HQQ50174.1 MFS transporter [Spirochaetota bacterium]
MKQKNGFAKKELFAVILIALMNLFLFADQNLMAPNLTQIAHDFGFNDVQRDVMLGGRISFVFWILGGLITLAIGYLTDKISRRNLFLFVIIIGEIPCLLTGFAQNYDQLFWLRALTGIGIGGALPLTFSIIGDYFSHENRAAASAWIGLAQGLGIAIGQLMAGFIGPVYGWRLPFIVVAIPNFILALIFLLLVKEPQRGKTEESLKELIEEGKVYTGKVNWHEYKSLFKIKTNILVFLQGIPGTVPWGVFFIFLNDFYSQDKGYSVQIATLIVMTVGAAAILGGFIGGFIGNWLYNIKPKYLPMLCGISTLIGIIPMALLLNYTPQVIIPEPDPTLPLIYGFITGFMVTITGPNVRAILLNVNTPETRGSIFSLFNLTDDLGKGFGPVVISALIVMFGRLMAFNIANLFWLLCGLLLLVMVKTFPEDEARLNAILKEKAEKMK